MDHGGCARTNTQRPSQIGSQIPLQPCCWKLARCLSWHPGVDHNSIPPFTSRQLTHLSLFPPPDRPTCRWTKYRDRRTSNVRSCINSRWPWEYIRSVCLLFFLFREKKSKVEVNVFDSCIHYAACQQQQMDELLGKGTCQWHCRFFLGVSDSNHTAQMYRTTIRF